MISSKSVQDFLRGPTFIGISVGGGIIAACSLAGVANVTLAKIVLFVTWAVFVIECYCSKWIQSVRGYQSAVVLILAFFSGIGSVYIALDIASKRLAQESKKEQPSNPQIPSASEIADELSKRLSQPKSPPLANSPLLKPAEARFTVDPPTYTDDKGIIFKISVTNIGNMPIVGMVHIASITTTDDSWTRKQEDEESQKLNKMLTKGKGNPTSEIKANETVWWRRFDKSITLRQYQDI